MSLSYKHWYALEGELGNSFSIEDTPWGKFGVLFMNGSLGGESSETSLVEVKEPCVGIPK